jgi:hypothetical protein
MNQWLTETDLPIQSNEHRNKTWKKKHPMKMGNQRTPHEHEKSNVELR